MDAKTKLIFINAFKSNRIFTRLKKVTTMLSPAKKYTNRLTHTEDVVKIAQEMNLKIVNQLYFPYEILDFEEACYLHDIGHCCFAHETEKVINEFISEKLEVSEEDVCFSHAMNGAVVFAIACKPSRKKTALSKLNLYDKNSPFEEDMEVIIDSVIKHSWKEKYSKGIYFGFVNKQYRHYTGKSLVSQYDIDVGKYDKPLYKTGYYVRVADDIATKNSDIMDLLEHYYGISLRKTAKSGGIASNYYIIADKYVDMIAADAIRKDKRYFDIEGSLKENELHNAQGSLLKQTYQFDYKGNITEKCQLLVKEILNLVYDDPAVLKHGYSSGYKYIKDLFVKSYGYRIEKLNTAKDDYYRNSGKKNKQFNGFSNYVCSIAYQISNFTDVDLIEFALNLQKDNKLSEEAIEAAEYLRKLYGIKKRKGCSRPRKRLIVIGIIIRII